MAENAAPGPQQIVDLIDLAKRIVGPIVAPWAVSPMLRGAARSERAVPATSPENASSRSPSSRQAPMVQIAGRDHLLFDPLESPLIELNSRRSMSKRPVNSVK